MTHVSKPRFARGDGHFGQFPFRLEYGINFLLKGVLRYKPVYKNSRPLTNTENPVWPSPGLMDNRLSLPQTYRRESVWKSSEERILKQLKRNALELVRSSGKSAAAVARDLGIDPELLNRWGWEAAREGNGTKAFTGHGVPRDEEMARLLREVEDLREANKILKKAVAIFSVNGKQR